MPRHTTMKKRRVNKSGTRNKKRGAGAVTRKHRAGARAGTRKRVSGAGKRKHTTVRKRRGGTKEKGKRKNRVMTTIFSPATAARDAVAGRRLAQAMALRLGFDKKAIGDIIGQAGFADLPQSIRKSDSVIKDMKDLGQIKGKCTKAYILGNGGKYKHGRWRTTTALKGPFTAGANAAAGRRLLQAMALRLGFKPETIYKIMDEEKIKGVPTTISKNKELKKKLGNIGKLTGSCGTFSDVGLNTNSAPFKDFGNTGNIITRRFNREKKLAHARKIIAAAGENIKA